MRPNSRMAASFKRVVDAEPGTNRTFDQLAPRPSMKRSLAGLLVTNVPMKNQPKIRPVRCTSIRVPLDPAFAAGPRAGAFYRGVEKRLHPACEKDAFEGGDARSIQAYAFVAAVERRARAADRPCSSTPKWTQRARWCL